MKWGKTMAKSEMVKVVIEMPKEKYDSICSMYGTFPAEMKEWGLEYIKNGTVLSKKITLTMNDLKECPFCHIQGERITVKSRYRKGTANRLMYWVSCGYCGASQPHDDLHGFRTPEKAIEKWNKVSAEYSERE